MHDVMEDASYVKEFDEEMIGLTGSRSAINNAARTFRVYHSKANEYGNDYLIDHSIITVRLVSSLVTQVWF